MATINKYQFASLNQSGSDCENKSIFPLSYCRILQANEVQIVTQYGNGHGGIDVISKNNHSNAVIAHSEGKVVWCQSCIPSDYEATGNRSYGNVVRILHKNGYTTLYAHLESLKTELGDTVAQGQLIGYVGNTGKAQEPHLHFEVRDSKNNRVDPTNYLIEDLPNLMTNTVKPESAQYTLGRYEVVADVLAVRTGPSTGYSWKSFSELSTNARDQIVRLCGYHANGYVKGMLCEVSKISGIWGKTSSGWICLKYCKKAN